jgi:hypothetical protein
MIGGSLLLLTARELNVVIHRSRRAVVPLVVVVVVAVVYALAISLNPKHKMLEAAITSQFLRPEMVTVTRQEFRAALTYPNKKDGRAIKIAAIHSFTGIGTATTESVIPAIRFDSACKGSRSMILKLPSPISMLTKM